MKRIYNDVPVQSILFVVPTYQKIRIVEHESEYELSEQAGRLVFEGTVYDTIGGINGECKWRWLAAKCHGLRIENGDTLVFEIYTKYEQF